MNLSLATSSLHNTSSGTLYANSNFSEHVNNLIWWAHYVQYVDFRHNPSVLPLKIQHAGSHQESTVTERKLRLLQFCGVAGINQAPAH